MTVSSSTISLRTVDGDFCKRLKDPYNDRVYVLEALLPFTEVAKLPRGNANVRPANRQKLPYKRMVETVEGDPKAFHIKNRGITYFCQKFEYDNGKKSLVVTVPPQLDEEIDEYADDSPKFGIADGGHTFTVIEDCMPRFSDLKEDNGGWSEPFVRVRFLAGDINGAVVDAEVVEALNTSTQVQPYTLDEYKSEFDELKDALNKAGFDAELVAFRENEAKEWHVIEIIQRLACFLKDRWQLTQPAQMYKSKNKALDLYRDNREEFQRLYDVIVDVVTLPEFIQSEFSQSDKINRRSFGRLKAVKQCKEPWCRPGTTFTTQHTMNLAALLPMAAAFRELLVLRGDRYQWKIDSGDVLRHCSDQLLQLLVTSSRRAQKISQLGSDMEYWNACVPIVMRAKDELMENRR